MSPHEQPRQASGFPIGGRWAVAPHAEPSVVLHDEVRYLSFLAGELADPATASAMSPNIVADFARRVAPFLAGQPAGAPELPDAPEPQEPIRGELGMMASCREATERYDLRAGMKWAKVRDGVNGPLEWTIMADPSSLTADYTLHGRENLTETIDMAIRNGARVRRTRTIDYPGDESWLRLTVTADGALRGPMPIDPPYRHALDALAASDVVPFQLRDAASTIEQNQSNGRGEVAHLASLGFAEHRRAAAKAVILTMLEQHPDGSTGVCAELRLKASMMVPPGR